MQQLLPLGSALDPERIPSTLAKLTDEREREALRIGEAQLRRLHRQALRKLGEVVSASSELAALQGRG